MYKKQKKKKVFTQNFIDTYKTIYSSKIYKDSLKIN